MKLSKRLFSVLFAIMLLLSLSACGNVNDYSIACYKNGTITYENYGKGTDKNTVFELGSNGKTVAAYTALALVEEGKIGLDDEIIQYLDPTLLTEDPRLQKITLRQLLCHTAGFSPSYELGVDKKIYSEPGKEFRYSGVGYIYLQSVIENVSGMSIDRAASHYVFEPLGMKNSTFEKAHTVTPYVNSNNAVLYAFLIFTVMFILLFIIGAVIGKITKYRYCSLKNIYLIGYMVAGIINTVFLLFFFMPKIFVVFLVGFIIIGAAMLIARKHSKLYYACVPVIILIFFVLGFVLSVGIPVTNDLVARKANCAYSLKSTSEDMAAFCSELMSKAEDDEDFMNIMFNPAVEIDDKNAWGLGIAIEQSSGSGTTYWHSGINPGFQSLYVLYPEQDRFIVVVTNSDRGLDLAKEKARSFLSYDGVWDIKR